MDWRKALRRAARNPGMAMQAARGLLRGQYYRLKYRLTGQRVQIGKMFQVNGRLDIRGPGTVIFGDNCRVFSSYIAPTTPWTHKPEAVIRFGDGVLLTGTRLGCSQLIEVGNYAGLAECRVMDSDYHSVELTDGPRYNSGGRSRAISIGANAWLGAASIVLKGVRIGENAVVGAGAVVANDVPANSVVFGNPARVIWRIRPPSNDQSTPETQVLAAAGKE